MNTIGSTHVEKMLNFTHRSRNPNYSGATEAILNRREGREASRGAGTSAPGGGGREAEPVGPHARRLAGA